MPRIKKPITNIEDLRQDLIGVYQDLRNGEMGIREAKEINNSAGKINSTAKLQLEYNVYTKSGNRIPFLEVSN